MGLDRFELSTPSLSEKCSNQLSYRPSGLGIHAFASFKHKDRSIACPCAAISLKIKMCVTGIRSIVMDFSIERR